MILTSTTEAVEFRVPWRTDDPKAPVFFLRAGSVIERGQMEAEIAGPHRAALVHGFELRAAVKNGITTLLGDDPEHESLIALFDTELEHEIAKGEAQGKGQEPPADPLSAEDRQKIAAVHSILGEHWPEYRELQAQMQRRRQIMPIVALKRFCTNIVAPGLTFARSFDGQVSEATLAALQPMEMMFAGDRAYTLQYGSGEEAEKNSERPPSSGAGPKSSGSPAKSKAAGK